MKVLFKQCPRSSYVQTINWKQIRQIKKFFSTIEADIKFGSFREQSGLKLVFNFKCHFGAVSLGPALGKGFGQKKTVCHFQALAMGGLSQRPLIIKFIQ